MRDFKPTFLQSLLGSMNETQMRWIENIRHDFHQFSFTPHMLMSDEFIYLSVMANGFVLSLITEDKLKEIKPACMFRSEADTFYKELCMFAVSQNGMSIQYVPDEYRTPELCLSAVQSQSMAICFVPPKWRTSEIYIEAVRNSDTVSLWDILVLARNDKHCQPDFYTMALEKVIELYDELPEMLERFKRYVPSNMHDTIMRSLS